MHCLVVERSFGGQGFGSGANEALGVQGLVLRRKTLGVAIVCLWGDALGSRVVDSRRRLWGSGVVSRESVD